MQKNKSPFLLRFQNIGTVLFLTLIVFISACKKDTLIKTGVQPVQDNLSIAQVDTFTIIASSYKLDSIRTDGVETGIFGYNTDPVFGTSKASFVSQLKPSGEGITFTSIDDVIIDSVLFSIQPEICYGNITTPTSFNLYEITDELILEDNHYSFETFNIESTPLSIADYDSIIYVDSLGRFLTIDFQLDNSYGVSLLQSILTSSDPTEFWQTYKGFTIIPNTASFLDDLLIHSDPYSINTKLTVYYKQASSPAVQETYDFIIDNQCERINLFENDYTTGSINGAFNDNSLGQEALYLQDMSGVGVNLSIPGISDLYQGTPIVVNSAELIIPINATNTSELPQHSTITIGAYSSDSLILNTVDAGTQEPHFSGNIQGDEFVFNITRDVQLIYDQYIIGNNVNFGYSLLSLSPEQNTNSSVLLGTNPALSTEKMKFVLTYSLAK